MARLAPTSTLLTEIASVAAHFATNHGERLARDIGVDPLSVPVDLTGVKASFGLDAGVEGLTYRQLQERRETIRRRLSERGRRGKG